MKVELKKSWGKKEEKGKKKPTTKKEQVAPCALLLNSGFAASRGAHGAVLALEHPEGLACPSVPVCSRAATAWEELQSQQCCFSLALRAFHVNSCLAGPGETSLSPRRADGLGRADSFGSWLLSLPPGTTQRGLYAGERVNWDSL